LKVAPYDAKPGTIQLPVRPFSVDWEAASRAIRPNYGVVYVEMAPYIEKRGDLYLSDETKQRDRADCGVVLACGLERGPKWPLEAPEMPIPMEIRPGDKVLVDPYRGIKLQNAQFGEYGAQGWVRIYGLASGDYNEHYPYAWQEVIFAVIDEQKTGKESIRATGKWLFIERDRIKESKGGVLLTDRSAKQSGLATILAVGKEAAAQGYREGMRIHFPPALSYDSGLYEVSHAKEFGLDSDNYAFLDWKNVLSVVE
jgi:co-chaperonin GroES (HSP10)